MKRKLLALLLAVCMVVCLLPTTALAAETVSIGDRTVTTVAALTSALSGVGTVSETDGKITVTLTKNVVGRINFKINGAYIVFDANGKTFSGSGTKEPLCLENYANLTVELIGDGTIINGGNNAIYVGANNSLIIKSATITGKLYDYYAGSAKTVLQDGMEYYTVQVNGGEPVGYTTAQSLTSSICGANDTVVVRQIATVNAEAKIGMTLYETLADALGAATPGDIITLLDDVALTETLIIPADKTVTFDLNGHTISQTKAQTEAYQMILNDGNLTIKDSGDGGKISYTDTVGGNFVSNAITNRGTLTLKSGTVENLSSADVANAGFPYAIDTSINGPASEVVVNIEGGTVTCANYSALRIFAQSTTEPITINISGGTINGRIEVQNPSNKTTDDYAVPPPRQSRFACCDQQPPPYVRDAQKHQ